MTTRKSSNPLGNSTLPKTSIGVAVPLSEKVQCGPQGLVGCDFRVAGYWSPEVLMSLCVQEIAVRKFDCSVMISNVGLGFVVIVLETIFVVLALWFVDLRRLLGFRLRKEKGPVNRDDWMD